MSKTVDEYLAEAKYEQAGDGKWSGYIETEPSGFAVSGGHASPEDAAASLKIGIGQQLEVLAETDSRR